MARAATREYVQWLEENNFNPEDEKLILKTTTIRMFIWLILSCIPTVNIFVLPFLMNAWSMRKILKQKSFEPRPGILYSLFAVAMYISFIMIIPWILWKLVKKFMWGTGLRGLIRKGKVGNGNPAVATAEGVQATFVEKPKKGFPWIVLVIVIAVIIAAFVIIGLTEQKTPAQAIAVLDLYEGRPMETVTDELDRLGIPYTVIYVQNSDLKPGTVIRQNPSSGALLDIVNSVELTVVATYSKVPDFSAATSADEINTLAQKNGITVSIIYTNASTGETYSAIPDGMVIDKVSANYTPGQEIPIGTEVIVTVGLKSQFDLAGSWYSAEYTYGSLYITRYTFREDGTFDYYYMGYMAVDSETELYTYGTYWSGAMGADSYSGTYQVSESQITFSYEYWDWGTEKNEHATRTMDFSLSGGSMILGYAEQGIYTEYLPGTQPHPDTPAPFSPCGSWYALGSPSDTEFGDRSLEVHAFYLFLDGSFKSFHCNYLNSGNGWYYPGAGSTLVGEYTFDGTNLVLRYTKELVPNYDNDGNVISNDPVPFEQTHTLSLTIENGVVTAVKCDTLGLNNFIMFDSSPYVNVDLMGEPLEHANRLFP